MTPEVPENIRTSALSVYDDLYSDPALRKQFNEFMKHKPAATISEQLNEILNSSITSDDIKPFVNSKKLYKACLNEGELKLRFRLTKKDL